MWPYTQIKEEKEGSFALWFLYAAKIYGNIIVIFSPFLLKYVLNFYIHYFPIFPVTRMF